MNYDLNPIVVYTANSYKQMKELQRYHLRNLRYISIGAAIIALLLIIYGLVIFSLSGGFNQIFTYGIFYTIISIFLWLASNGVLYTSKRHESITHLMRNGVTVFFVIAGLKRILNTMKAKESATTVIVLYIMFEKQRT